MPMMPVLLLPDEGPREPLRSPDGGRLFPAKMFLPLLFEPDFFSRDFASDCFSLAGFSRRGSSLAGFLSPSPDSSLRLEAGLLFFAKMLFRRLR
mmetsp:Transcript_43634/g.57823  ORF Transcript_43634/g.57823 Transcript_43634/m.57823 type:complete len:94 (-) Transcript_43634:3788-4069(-)